MTTQKMLELANLGNVDAMYNLGVIYSTGNGEKKNKPLAKMWYEKAAANGDSDAKNLVESMTASDTAKRVAISFKIIQAYESFCFGRAGFADSIASYKEALTESEDLWSPTDDDLFQRREVCRYLGMITYLNEGNDYLKIAESYYESGLPVEETKDLRTAAFYAALMKALHRATGDVKYFCNYYNVSESVYRTRFNDTDDNDIKCMFLQNMISEKILGEVFPMDLDGAAQLNEIIGSFGNDFSSEYESNRQNIEKARQIYAISSENTSIPPTKKKRLFGRFFK